MEVNEFGELTHFLYGGARNFLRLKAVWKRVEGDAAFDKARRPYMNHSQRYVDSLGKVKRFQVLCDELMPDDASWSLDRAYDVYLAMDENTPLDVHLSMFIPVLMHHTSAQQRARWLPRAQRFRMIGAYAQTELGHGSNVRALETTATLDKRLDVFVIHSPTLSSTKFWPGGLGHTCTHAIVYARLLLGDTDKGVHPFMVPLRCPKTHAKLPGVDCGDIGPKHGYNAMDNGYARFTHVHIPRDNLLGGIARVDARGTYHQETGSDKRQGGIMLSVRARIVKNSSYVLARAVTIAVRYSHVRLQGTAMSRDPHRPTEHAVIQYPQQQKMVFPLLALTYAIHCSGTQCWRMYHDYLSDADNMGRLAELHCTSSGLKALVTQLVCDGMETCRQACGGHAFLTTAGFQELLTSYLPFKTLEGTREVLYLQTGKWLVGLAGGQMASLFGPKPPLPPSAAYLSYLQPSWCSLLWGHQGASNGGSGGAPVDLVHEAACLSPMTQDWSELDQGQGQGAMPLATRLLQAFEQRARYCIVAATTALHQRSRDVTRTAAAVAAVATGEPTPTPTESVGRAYRRALREKAVSTEGVVLARAAEAHSELLIVRALHSACVCSATAAETGAGANEGRRRVGGGAELPHCHLPLPELSALRRMLVLLQCTFMERSLGDFLVARCFVCAPSARRGLDALTSRLLADILPHSSRLVDAFALSDLRLDSTLGRADGRVYEAIFAAAQQEPLNATDVSIGYTRHLRDVLLRPMPGDNGSPPPLRPRL